MMKLSNGGSIGGYSTSHAPSSLVQGMARHPVLGTIYSGGSEQMLLQILAYGLSGNHDPRKSMLHLLASLLS